MGPGLKMTRNGQRLLMLIDADPARRRTVTTVAARGGWRTITADDGASALSMMATQDGMQLDAILLDHEAEDTDPAPVIAELRAYRPQLPILLITSHASVMNAVSAMRSGTRASGRSGVPGTAACGSERGPTA